MRPFDFLSPPTAAAVRLKSAPRADAAPHWDSALLGRDLIYATIVAVGTFATVWMVAMLIAFLILTSG